jgi:2-polyprenyl-6-hydroxyphenyl methylase/3-demethylubiquinone-9 3-methyltransferase
MNTTINEDEIRKFEKIAQQWWDPNGFFRPLHIMAPTRINYIKSLIQRSLAEKSANNISIIDIGCGGGLISEPFAKLGFQVNAIDASDVNIKIAAAHADSAGVKVHYHTSTAEEYSLNGKKHDVVLALEIVEHVSDLPLFIKSLSQIVADNGIVIISTLNRTVKSYLAAIIGAEYIFKWLPIGTHDWQKFITPSELLNLAQQNHLTFNEIKGLKVNPITLQCSINESIDINYFISFRKM